MITKMLNIVYTHKINKYKNTYLKKTERYLETFYKIK